MVRLDHSQGRRRPSPPRLPEIDDVSIAITSLIVGAVLPYVWVGVAKASARGYDNRDPRGWIARQGGLTQRANAAQLNAFEAYPPFAAAMLLALWAGVDAERLGMLGLAFIVARIAHGVTYLLDMATLRSVAWFGGIAVVGILFHDAWKAAA
jgi:uncharacterized MAPEG superfamily protein